jgi:UPF0755 protein
MPVVAPPVEEVQAPEQAFDDPEDEEIYEPDFHDPDFDDDDDGHDYVELRHEGGGIRRGLAILVVFVLVIGAGVGGVRWWYLRQVDPPGGPGAAIVVDIPSGSSTSRIGDILHSEGVVANSTVFNFYVSRKHAGPFQAGRYHLQQHSALDSVIKVLQKGPAVASVVRVTFPEGFTLAQIAARLSATVPRWTNAKILAALGDPAVRSAIRPSDQASWEGLLYPATYDVSANTQLVPFLADLAQRESGAVAAAATPARLAAINAKWGLTLTPYQALIVASLIQREAATTDEAPMIATVIYNRLQQGTPLGIDATSGYLATLTGTPIDFTSPSPYNTRRNKGLPPTPIATVSDWALQGAVAPADGPWIYYVLTAPGHDSFESTYQGFEADKAICKAKKLGCG